MKKILLVISLLVSVTGFSQNVPNYTNIAARYKWIAGAFDSTLHIPQYNGVPSGLRVKSWQADGAIAIDTTTGYVYVYQNSSWIKLAKFSDVGSAYTFTNGLTESPAGTIKLGGLLTESTIIDGNSGAKSLEFINLDSWQAQGIGSFAIGFPEGSIGTSGVSGLGVSASYEGKNSKIQFYGDTLYILPSRGNLYIDSLNTGTTSDKVLLRTSTGLVKEIAQSSIVGAAHGIDDVLAVNQALTANRTIRAANHRLTIDSVNDLRVFGYDANARTTLQQTTDEIFMEVLNLSNNNYTDVFINDGSFHILNSWDNFLGGSDGDLYLWENGGNLQGGVELFGGGDLTHGLIHIQENFTDSSSVLHLKSEKLNRYYDFINMDNTGVISIKTKRTPANTYKGISIDLDHQVFVDSMAAAGVAADSVVVITSGGQLKKRNAASFGGGSGTVNSGTQYRMAYYATSTNAVSETGTNLTYGHSSGTVVSIGGQPSGTFASYPPNLYVETPTAGIIPGILVNVASGAASTSRGIMVSDYRTGSHQPSIGVISQSESDIFGLKFVDNVATYNTISSDQIFSINDVEKFKIGTSAVTNSVRLLTKQGADIASVAGAITLGGDGNTFEITGTNAITLISNLGWQNGAEITLLFTSTASLTDGTANSGTDIGLELAGNANFTGSADDVIKLVLSEIGGTQRWREVSRSVN